MKNQGGGKNFPVTVSTSPESKLTLDTPKLPCEGEAREGTKISGQGSEILDPNSRGGELNLSGGEPAITSGQGTVRTPTPSAALHINRRKFNKLAASTNTPPKSARDLHVTLCDNKLAGRLNKAWHSRVPEITWGGTACNPCFAAVYDNIVYAVALWSCPIAGNRIVDGFRCLELRRMAVAPDAPKFTASRFLSQMVKAIRRTRPDVIKLISYQDTAVHKGTIYKASGWTLERTTEFVSWGITGRKGHGKLDYQAPSPKNRWALVIRDKSESDKLIASPATQGDLF